MKVFTLNSVRLPREQKNVFSGEKSKIIARLSALALIILYSLNISAQGVQELSQALAPMKTSSSATDQYNYARITSLVSGINPTVYINNSIIKTSSDASPVCADVDLNSLSGLVASNTLFNQVEMLKIRLDNDNLSQNILNLNNLPSFTNLKYVLFICSYDCDLRTIYSLYQPAAQGGISVFYQISIPN
jgi:hypothetical protein